jgi:hypothetical protein
MKIIYSIVVIVSSIFLYSCGFNWNVQNIENEDINNLEIISVSIGSPIKRYDKPFFMFIKQDKNKKDYISLGFDLENIEKAHIVSIYWNHYKIIVNAEEKEFKEINKELNFNDSSVRQEIDVKFNGKDKIILELDIEVRNETKTERKILTSKYISCKRFGPFILIE